MKTKQERAMEGIDLFAGAGSFTEGAEQAGVKLIRPVFQPIVRTSGRVHAFEALMRLPGARTSPLLLIQEWEKSGAISLADLAMADRAAEAAAALAWRPRLSLNVSVATVERAGALYVQALQRLAPFTCGVMVELTETAPVRHEAALRQFVAVCKANGFSVALDDCQPGHQHGDAAYVRTIGADAVKIDGAWLHRCLNSPAQAQGLREFIRHAKQSGAKVVAEFISSDEMRAFALGLGADLLQGFAVGLPGELPSTKHASVMVEQPRNLQFG